MTYIVGWKTGGNAYLCADTALTSFDQTLVDSDQLSSFGEAHINEPDRQVNERALKILRLEHAVVAICGDYMLALATVELMSRFAAPRRRRRECLQTVGASV